MSRVVQAVKLFSFVAAGGLLLVMRRVAAHDLATAEQRAPAKKKNLARTLLTVAALLVVVALGGLLVAASGIIPIKASSGHWPITAWFLNYSMSRSISTHTLGMKAPPLDEQWMVLKGAGHYETGCRPCHSSPERPIPRVAASMTPPPPFLPPAISEWEPEELFYIVKHGVKFTGMPAWPTQQRDDEVWAMVAFLQQLPELNAEEYHQLANGGVNVQGEVVPLSDLTDPQETPDLVIESCARCHGLDGQGRGTGAFPKLAGQKLEYLAASLHAFAQGERQSGIMEPIAARLSPDEIHKLAQYYGGLKPSTARPTQQSSAEAIARGEVIARQGLPNQRVPACADCHGPSEIRKNPHYPLLAGQYAEYLVLQLELFKMKHRGGTPYAHLMHPVANHLPPQAVHDVAQYYQSLPPDQPKPQ